MTTIVLAHPSERSPRFQVFGEYEAPSEQYVFDVTDISSRDDAEQLACHMMEAYEADHFRRVIEVGERIGCGGSILMI